jgi:hypothetical protein
MAKTPRPPHTHSDDVGFETAIFSPVRRSTVTAEDQRLIAARERTANWKRWGPYLSERQWGTVREDYSEWGDSWGYLPHDHARSRAYRWGEDGLLGICDRECRLCFALALWNGKDPILKERLFGLTGPEGNHGEDVKECYFYLDSSPTHSYLKALYKYPQAEYPYDRLVEENHRRGKEQREFELYETGVFQGGKYFDVFAEYAKGGPDDIAIRITVANRGPEAATLHLLPTLWFRNTWSWGRVEDGCEAKPSLTRAPTGEVIATHSSLGRFRWYAGNGPNGKPPTLLFTENDTNAHRLFGLPSGPHTKDAFHDYVLAGDKAAVNPQARGTKAAAYYVLTIPPGQSQSVDLRLTIEAAVSPQPFGSAFDDLLLQRKRETDEFYSSRLPPKQTREERQIARQAYAGLLWCKQFYCYVVPDWIQGDPAQPAPPAGRRQGRNHEWTHLYNKDVLSMPDKWEYPWYAAWDLAFHMLPFARVDGDFAKDQLQLLLREWYMHPNGQLPAYEFAFDDVNPPVHAWASWRVYKMTGAKGDRDVLFLKRAFHKLMLNFTWWVNRKDPRGRNLFAGGFLGLDNIGVFDRSKPLPNGGQLEQADGTAWMAFYCVTMLAMALELAAHDVAYEDIASKFFEHFVAIADAINTLGGSGLWDEQDGFYYDVLQVDGTTVPLRIRSMVGLIPLFAVEVLDQRRIDKLPEFKKRMEWFLKHRPELARQISYCETEEHAGDGAVHNHQRRLLAIPSQERLQSVLRYLLDENEFLSPYGVRALSRVHRDRPFVLGVGGQEHRVAYDPGESTTGMFGGNSNWRGPVWFPVNYLLVEALERYHHFYGDELQVECPTGSGRMMNLKQVASELAQRLTRLFLPDASGRRPCHGDDDRFANDPHFRDLVLFYEYFHGDTGRGLGADHQTGWTALITRMLEDCARTRV